MISLQAAARPPNRRLALLSALLGLDSQALLQEGAIEFRDVTMAYREDLPPVLRGLSFQVKAREKVRGPPRSVKF